jgi:hypothetical protein
MNAQLMLSALFDLRVGVMVEGEGSRYSPETIKLEKLDLQTFNQPHI